MVTLISMTFKQESYLDPIIKSGATKKATIERVSQTCNQVIGFYKFL